MYITILKKNSKEKKYIPSFEKLLEGGFTGESYKQEDKNKLTFKVTDEQFKSYLERQVKFIHKTETYIEYYKNTYLEKIEPLLENMDTSQEYNTFYIPKKSNPNKKRRIDAPKETLKKCQQEIKNFLDSSGFLEHTAAHAYVKNRSTVTALERHQQNKSKFYLQLDLKDFFNSINPDFFRKIMDMTYPWIMLKPKIKELIIKAAFLNNELPQGSIISPKLTNLLMVPIDYEISTTLIAKNDKHLEYTRYADDITISSRQKFKPEKIINMIKDIFNKFETPFTINDSKTRFGNVAGRNYHLGLIINKENEIAAGHENNRKFRAMLYNFIANKDKCTKEEAYHIMGMIAYYKMFEKDFVEYNIFKYSKKYETDIMYELKHILNR